MALLTDKLEILETLEKNHDQVQIDYEHFEKDENRNRRIFYHEMRVSLSHKFIAMAAASGDDQNEPIIKHSREGTETR